MREADVAIRMHAPKQPDLVQRHLLTIRWQVVASPDYLKRSGTPQRGEDLDQHRLVLFGNYHPPVPDINWLGDIDRRPGSPRRAVLEVNNLQAMLQAVRAGVGVGALPDYMVANADGLVRLLQEINSPKVDVFFVYPEELRNSKRVAVFRDFLLARLAELA
jgi:DNA-binding transcriptional LysR family regulator